MPWPGRSRARGQEAKGTHPTSAASQKEVARRHVLLGMRTLRALPHTGKTRRKPRTKTCGKNVCGECLCYLMRTCFETQAPDADNQPRVLQQDILSASQGTWQTQQWLAQLPHLHFCGECNSMLSSMLLLTRGQFASPMWINMRHPSPSCMRKEENDTALPRRMSSCRTNGPGRHML